MDIWSQYVLPCLCAFAGCIGFTLVFNIHGPGKLIAGCGGALGWLVYLLVNLYVSNTLACFAATVVIVFCARLFAVWRKVPSNVFMISGIFPIVPGIGIYNTIYDIMIGDAAAAMSSGLETFKAVAAIVLGIVCVFVIPNKWFRSLR